VTNIKDTEYLIELWLHEMNRVFYDRLIDSYDRDYYLGIIRERIM
jgi:hypothetical protein